MAEPNSSRAGMSRSRGKVVIGRRWTVSAEWAIAENQCSARPARQALDASDARENLVEGHVGLRRFLTDEGIALTMRKRHAPLHGPSRSPAPRCTGRLARAR